MIGLLKVSYVFERKNYVQYNSLLLVSTYKYYHIVNFVSKLVVEKKINTKIKNSKKNDEKFEFKFLRVDVEQVGYPSA